MKTELKKKSPRSRKKSPAPYLVAAVPAALVVGVLLGRGLRSGTNGEAGGTPPSAEEAEATVWTCSMHPEIRLPEQTPCPLCGMDLVPVDTAGEDLGPREIKLSPHAEKLAEVRTAPVERRPAQREVRMAGQVAYDESQVRNIAAWVPGRLDRLYVDYTGMPVREGDHLVSLFSPELISAQEELLQAARARDAMGGQAVPAVRERAGRLVDTAREKLRLLGLTQQQIAEVESKGAVEDRLTLHAPISGVVIDKPVREGMYVETGTSIYTIARLDRLWVLLDAYESDLGWVRYGQRVAFEAEALPGERFEGTVAFVDPMLDATTRTVKVRLHVDNAHGRLKPGMFVRSTLLADVAAGGRVMEPDLAGKYICPMHPEVVEDGPGSCRVCGMDLETAESQGFVTVAAETPLVIPATAPLRTGKRAVVYVADPDRPGVFESREVILGPRAGEVYLVERGLREGEQVVANGAFKIDSAMQIQARPGMMSMDPEPGHDLPPEFFADLEGALEQYYALYRALADDDFDKARETVAAVAEAVDGKGPLWQAPHLAARKAAAARDIAQLRVVFEDLSKALTALVRHHGTEGRVTVMLANCPMAFDDRGADWLQPDDDILNPYFGDEMLHCGYIKETLEEEVP